VEKRPRTAGRSMAANLHTTPKIGLGLQFTAILGAWLASCVTQLDVRLRGRLVDTPTSKDLENSIQIRGPTYSRDIYERL
jgi:hypothetical protein